MSLHRQLLVLPIKEQQVCDKLKGLTPVKDIIDHRHNKAYDEYFLRSPVETHTKEELDAVHRAILYTHLFKREESMRKMDEEELLYRPMPKISFSAKPNKRK
jgi:hypothetical protein